MFLVFIVCMMLFALRLLGMYIVGGTPWGFGFLIMVLLVWSCDCYFCCLPFLWLGWLWVLGFVYCCGVAQVFVLLVLGFSFGRFCLCCI